MRYLSSTRWSVRNITMLRAISVIALVLLAGCAAPQPKPPVTRPAIQPRAPSEDDRFKISAALAPLLRTAGLWRGPEDGCAVGLGILPMKSINLGVAAHPTCRFSLLVTEGALEQLPPEELRAALAHELGHVELDHVIARRARRQEERSAGPMLSREPSELAKFRAYDRDEERAADRYAVELLTRLPGDGTGCRALAALLRRLEREGRRPEYYNWLSTHPSPVARLDAIKETCS
jgi:Zn-dependent protease with chaperone function